MVALVGGDVKDQGLLEAGAFPRDPLDGPVNGHVDDPPVDGAEVREHVCDGVADVHVLVEDGGPQVDGFRVGGAADGKQVIELEHG